MRLGPSDELLLLARPFTAYAAIGRRPEEPGLWRAIRRPLLALLMIGSFVSVTTAGRFTIVHVVFAAISWSFLPAIQIAWLLALRSRVARAIPAGASVDLFFAGQSAYYAFFCAVMLLIVAAPGLADRISGLYWIGIFGAGILAAQLHGIYSTAAFMRQIWLLSRAGTFTATVTYYLAVSGTLLLYYVSMGQLLPLLVPHP